MFRGLIEGDMRAQRSTAPPNHWHHLHVEEVLRLLDVDLKASLSAVEVKRRLEKFGPNVVRPGEARLPGSSFSSSSTNPSFSSCSRSPHKAES